MFSALFKHEIRYWLQRPLFYIYAGIFFVLALLVSAHSAGIFDIATASTGSAFIVNSPYAIAQKFNVLSSFIFFLLPSIIGVSIYRDYKSSMHSILYSYPFTKTNYLTAKYLSSLLIVTAIVILIGLGMIIGFRLPGTKTNLLTSFDLLAYLHPYAVYILPNILLFGAIVFAVVAFSRSIAAGFIVIVILTLIQGLMQALLYDPDNQLLSALIDPFGGASTEAYIRYWTVAEMNEKHLPFEGYIIYNRLLWLGITTIISGLVYRFFKFHQQAISFSFKSKASSKSNKKNFGSIIKVKLPTVSTDFSFPQQLKATWKLSNIDLKYIIKSLPFICIIVVALTISLVELSEIGNLRGTPKLPVTWRMLNFSEAYLISIHICSFLYAGLLIHRAKTANINQLVDSTPIANWALLGSKLLAVLKMQLILLAVIMFAGITFQLYKGYFKFEIGVYLYSLFLINFAYFMVWALLGFFIQTLIRNPYLGLIIMIILVVGAPVLRAIGIEQDLFIYSNGPWVRYSDMNGFGAYTLPFFAYKFYWAIAGFAFIILANLLWVRGLPQSFKKRISTAKARFSGITKYSFASLLIVFLSLGFTFYHEDNIANKRVSSKEREQMQATWEKTYKKYENYPQPRIVSVKTEVNIFPKALNLTAKGTYVLVNKTNEVIDSIFLSYNQLPSTFSFNKPNQLVSKDEDYYFDIYQLTEALHPGDSLELQFTIQNKPNTWLRLHAPVQENGTFFNNKEVFPSIGYNYQKELTDDEIRKQYGLAPNKLLPHPSDTSALGNHALSRDADWIDFEAIVSTSSDQIAIAPGYLQKEWTIGDRRYFHYKMDIPMLNFYAFNSARYEVKRDKWNDVNLEIYYHKGHEYNLDRMMSGMKASLAYCAHSFSPYQHKQARIIEFPRTQGSFAQAFANTIPFSESHGFIADVDDTERGGIDYAFGVTAHEIAHQWWAHQVIGADVLGSSMLSESMAEYVRLKVFEHHYGKGKLRKFLKYALDNYLRKRRREQKREPALMYNDGQHYIRYSKGSMVLYAISDYLGEDILNAAIQQYVEQVKFQEPPYTTTLELVDYIRAKTPDSLQYIITDMLETVTLYENKVIKAEATEVANGKYQVDIEFEVIKYRNDEKGNRFYRNQAGDSLVYQTESMRKPKLSVPLADYIEVGIFTETEVDGEKKEKELYLSKHKITSINNKITLIVNQKPTAVGIDPYNKLIDTDSQDNRKALP